MPINTADRERLRKVKSFPSLVKYLREDLEWPIESDDFEAISFDYTPEELGINSKNAAKIIQIKQLRPLATGQPWGVFFVEFAPKRLPIVVLRKILARLVVKKPGRNPADRQVWDLHDLLFISNFGDDDERHLTFAHFTQDEAHADLPELKVLGWDEKDTALHFDLALTTLKTNLAWRDGEAVDDWRRRWAGAFRLRPRQVINTSKELAIRLAALAREIRAKCLQSMDVETDHGPLKSLMAAFKTALIHDLDEAQFADLYAQTISYGLLSMAIRRTVPGEGHAIVVDNLVDLVNSGNPFLKELLTQFLNVGGRRWNDDTGKLIGIDFDELGVNDVVDTLRQANMEAVLADFGNRNPQEDPVIHFYELFLKEYDAKMRIQRGVFYTPRPAVSYIVRSVHELLQTEFGLVDGLADTATWADMLKRHRKLKLPEIEIVDPETREVSRKPIDPATPFVQILDPAVGTATFLVEVIDVIHQTMVSKWKKEGHADLWINQMWNEYVPKHLLPRLHGFELMMAPYAIAHMKIGLKLFETAYTFGPGERARIYLTNSLEPHQDFSDRLAFDVPALAHEALAVNEVKATQVFTVVVGNPPYLREKEKGPERRNDRIGGWVRFGDPERNTPALFDDFIQPLADMGLGVHAKLAYELSVIFWRLVLWMVFEKYRCPGIVAMISPRAYIAGPGHAGVRRHMRSVADQVWLTDLGGDNRGTRKSKNIFDIETGVAIGICVKLPGLKPDKATCIAYQEIKGTSEQKLLGLVAAPEISKATWQKCAPGDDAFFPKKTGKYTSWPKLTDLFPWQHSGSQYKRLWPIGESKAVLEERWQCFMSLSPQDRANAFVETRDRVVDAHQQGAGSKRLTGLARLRRDAHAPPVVRYCYRSLDRQWCMLDERLADFIRPSLVYTCGPRQVFAATFMSKTLGRGPAVSVTNLLPDMDVFCNRGAKDVIPLWRDPAGTTPNVTPGLLAALSSRVGISISAEQLFAYCMAVLAGPAYTDRFEGELATPGPRIPIAEDAEVFREGVRLGGQFVWLQTFGERCLSPSPKTRTAIKGTAKLKKTIPEDEGNYPAAFNYDASTETLHVGAGSVFPLTPEVYGYSVSGFKVIESWLRYRMKERAGRAGGSRSELDKIRPRRWTFSQELLELLWVVEGCVALWPAQEEFLDAAIDCARSSADDLPLPAEADKQEPQLPDEPEQARMF